MQTIKHSRCYLMIKISSLKTRIVHTRKLLMLSIVKQGKKTWPRLYKNDEE